MGGWGYLASIIFCQYKANRTFREIAMDGDQVLFPPERDSPPSYEDVFTADEVAGMGATDGEGAVRSSILPPPTITGNRVSLFDESSSDHFLPDPEVASRDSLFPCLPDLVDSGSGSDMATGLFASTNLATPSPVPDGGDPSSLSSTATTAESGETAQVSIHGTSLL